MGARALLKETLGVIGRLSTVFSPRHPEIADERTAAVRRPETGRRKRPLLASPEICRKVLLIFFLWLL
jgi:hypothetical protein